MTNGESANAWKPALLQALVTLICTFGLAWYGSCRIGDAERAAATAQEESQLHLQYVERCRQLGIEVVKFEIAVHEYASSCKKSRDERSRTPVASEDVTNLMLELVLATKNTIDYPQEIVDRLGGVLDSVGIALSKARATPPDMSGVIALEEPDFKAKMKALSDSIKVECSSAKRTGEALQHK